MIFSIIALILLTLGIVLLVRGLRGYAIDRHPLCRKCGFDLTGKPPDSTRCPECGTDVSHDQAIRIGHRRRRPGLIYAGSFLLLLALSIDGSLFWISAQNIDTEQFLPTWWLIHEASDHSPGAPIVAWKELLRREQLGDLSTAQAQKIAAIALANQADQTITWNNLYGDFIESTRDAKLLTDTQWQQYARNAKHFSLAVRAKVRQGDSLPASIVQAPGRVSSKMRFCMSVYPGKASGDLVKTPSAYEGGSSSSGITTSGGGSMGTDIPLNIKAATTAPVGPRAVTLDADIEIREGFDRFKPIVAKWTDHLTANWELVPTDTDTVEIINDPSRKAAVEKSITINQLEYHDSLGDYLNLSINFNNPGVPLAYDIYIRADGPDHKPIEQKLSSITVSGNGSEGWGTGGEIKIQADHADVILRPNPAVARSSVNMTKLWNGEVTIKDVPIKRPATLRARAPAH